ncbi:nucleotide sugar dehydrogenase [Candidatus Woesearchaeota archaeon]|nr:nucleotide sugar dehydrogenase [Candidatus Woesearchaeota archaeon]
MDIAIIGLWHLGEVYSVCLSELGNKVYGIDENLEVINKLNEGNPPLEEPNLKKLLKKNLESKRLNFYSDYETIKKCNVVWITIDTPVIKNDKAKFGVIIETIKKLLPLIQNNSLIIISSQLPVKSSDNIIKYIQENRPNLEFQFAYLPENLILGEAVESFNNQKFVIVGSYNSEAIEKIRLIFKELKCVIQPMSPVSAEMVKHARNSFLATSLSFIYDIADVCEAIGADVVDVSTALRFDSRIGPKAYLDASIGFSGGTLGRDLQYLLQQGKLSNLKLPVIKAVYLKNQLRKKTILNRLIKLLNKWDNQKITFFGITYKSGTSTLRRSLATELIKETYKSGIDISICDPFIKEKELQIALKNIKYTYYKDPYKAVNGSQAIIIITPWNDLKEINFKKLQEETKAPHLYFDARNFFVKQEKEIKSCGFNYLGVGR